MTTVLVADRRDVFRSGVRALLEDAGDFDVVVARDVYEAVAAAEAGVDVALVDLDLPPTGGLHAVRELARCTPARIVVWSFDPVPETVLGAIRAGASGYLERTVSVHGFVHAVRAACRGEAAMPRKLTGMMIDALHTLDERARAREQAAALSRREREVLELVARGAANREIAAQLAISQFTVKRHIQNILQKLGLPSRRAAAAFWDVAGESSRVKAQA